MKWNRLYIPLLVGAGLLLLLLAAPGAARAGCGCDHPPPAWSLVMPPFGSPGRSVVLHPDTGAFEMGETYRISVSNRSIDVVADSEEQLEFQIPLEANPGPTDISVDGPGYVHTYPEELFTVMPPARAVPAMPGLFVARNFEVAISAGQTLLVPMDVGAVLDPTQFAFAFTNFPLSYGHDDVVIYNADGVDLTLFTLAVEDPTQRQWGQYYGWDVEQDAGLTGLVFDHFVATSLRLDRIGDLFSYWRHEFHTYAQAHAPGGSHEVDDQGLHPDGSRHVDHDHLVIAISGRQRLRSRPDETRALRPGSQAVNLAWLSIQTPGPIDPRGLLQMLDAGFDGAPELPPSEVP